jgi:hypothetical protein
MGWFNAGTDEAIETPELFGCVQLPDPESCFGEASVVYNDEQRDKMITQLSNDKFQNMPWPSQLKACFSTNTKSSKEGVLYGSPMLDEALGKVDTMTRVLSELNNVSVDKAKKMYNKTLPVKKSIDTSSNELKIEVYIDDDNNNDINKQKNHQSKNQLKSDKKTTAAPESYQFDQILPPEKPTSWVQCDGCRKWRRVAWHVEVETLSDEWQCIMNTWDVDNANCDAPQDDYDPDRETTVAITATKFVKDSIDTLQVGVKKDVYCLKNKIYYEAQVKKVRKDKKNGQMQVLFHFLGWNSNFDEWIDVGSDRIAPHNLHTNPSLGKMKQQEKYQGVEIHAVLVKNKRKKL